MSGRAEVVFFLTSGYLQLKRTACSRIWKSFNTEAAGCSDINDGNMHQPTQCLRITDSVGQRVLF